MNYIYIYIDDYFNLKSDIPMFVMHREITDTILFCAPNERFFFITL